MMADIAFDYQFKFDDGTSRGFKVKIDSDSGVLVDDISGESPDWTRLEFHQCSHCPYAKGELTHCPVAQSVARVAEAFKSELSHKATTVFVRTENRFYGKKTDLQTGLQSLFGLMMGSSRCSHMSLFKPMSRYHLPFSTFDETVVRVLGKFLISQYLRARQGGHIPDLELKALMEKYAQVSIVNRFLIQRVRSVSKGDADKNALVILDGFASLLPMEMQGGFEHLSKIFKDVS
jgi:hypothetical protein